MDSSLIGDANDIYTELLSWECKLLFNLSDEGEDTNIVDLLSYLESPFRLDKGHPATALFMFPPRYIGPAGQSDLVLDLLNAANSSGFKLVLYSKRKIASGCSIRMSCSNHRHHTPLISKDKEFKPDSLYASNLRRQCIRQNKGLESRGKKGPSMPKRNGVNRPTDIMNRCSFFFTIFCYDINNRWYLTKGWSGRSHCKHPMIDPEFIRPSISQINKDPQKLASDLFEVNANPSTISQVIQHRTGQLVSQQQFDYYKRKQAELRHVADSINDCSQSSADRLLKSLKETEGVSFIALFHDPDSSLFADRVPGWKVNVMKKRKEYTKKNHFWVTQRRIGNGDIITEMLSNEIANMALRGDGELDAEERRKAMQLSDSQTMLLAVVWATDEGIRLINLYPEVSFADTAHGTNNEQRPLFKYCAKDCNNQDFTAVDAFLPTTSTWVFDWLQNEALPLLIGVLPLVLNINYITDNDSKMWLPVVSSAGSKESPWYGTNHRLCMWHIVFCNFGSNVSAPSYMSPAQKSRCSDLVNTARDWVCTWFRYCETKSEIVASRRLLSAWLQLPEIIAGISQMNCDEINRRIEDKIMKHYAKWCRPDRLYLRCFDHVTSMTVEHENNAVKGQKGSVVHASMSIDTAANVINAKTKFRHALKSQAAAIALTSKPTWSKTPTSEHISKYAEGLLREQWQKRQKNVSVRVNQKKWYVRKYCKLTPFALDRPSTLFVRVRIVIMVEHRGAQYLKCSCGFHQRHGIPCDHILFITGEIKLEYICSRWFKIFRHYFARNDGITAIYRKSQKNPVPGCLWTEECPPQSEDYPVFDGIDNILYFTSVLESPVAVVSNFTDMLNVSDISVYNQDTHTIFIPRSAAPNGMGVSACLSPMRRANLVQDSNFHCPPSDDSFCEPSDDQMDDSDADHVDDNMFDLKTLYYEIVNLVEGDRELEVAAKNEFIHIKSKLTKMFNDIERTNRNPRILANDKAGVVSSNAPCERLKIRPRRKGPCG